MNSEERTLIDGLFSRLHDAERQSGARDAEADVHIAEHVSRQPAAPYYMAQTILIQEAALKRQDQRVKELEAQLAEMQQQRPSSGGFLSGLFGGGARDAQAQPTARPAGWGETRFSQGAAASDPRQAPQPAALPGQGGGFMRGALQTAAGVAGGMMVAEMLGGLFHHGSPTEIVEVVEAPPMQEPSRFDAGSPSDGFADDNYFDSGDFFDGGDDSFFS